MSKACIVGLGSYLPSAILTNQDLQKLVDTNDEWITSRVGIKERRIAASHEFASDMGFMAAEQALADTFISKEEIDLIIVATMSPDFISPSTATLIQHRLAASQAVAFDVQAACSGFLYGLSVAKAYIEAGIYQKIVVIATEKMSALIDYTDRNTCVLFGDGAAAAVLTSQQLLNAHQSKKNLPLNSMIQSTFLLDAVCLGTDGSLSQLLVIPAGGARHPATHDTVEQKQHYLKMAGSEVFKHATRRMSQAIHTCLEQAKLKESDISWLVPHQANIRIIQALAKNFAISPDRVYKTLHKYGNTSASALPIALNELTKEQHIKPAEHLLLVAFGGGLTWGATVLTKL